MKTIIITLSIFLFGCSLIPNKFVVNRDNIPADLTISVELNVTANDSKLAADFLNQLDKYLVTNNISTEPPPNTDHVNITIDLDHSEVEWTAFVEGSSRYYTDIDRLIVRMTVSQSSIPEPYLIADVGVDALIDNPSKDGKGYERKEDLNGLVKRVSQFLASLYLNVGSTKNIELAGSWGGMLSETKFNFVPEEELLVGYLESPKAGNIGFSDGEESFRIALKTQDEQERPNTIAFKIRYVDGFTRWMLADLHLYGCLMVIDPVQSGAPVGKIFLKKEDCLYSNP